MIVIISVLIYILNYTDAWYVELMCKIHGGFFVFALALLQVDTGWQWWDYSVHPSFFGDGSLKNGDPAIDNFIQ